MSHYQEPLEGAGIGLTPETSHGSFPLVIVIAETHNGILNHAIRAKYEFMHFVT